MGIHHFSICGITKTNPVIGVFISRITETTWQFLNLVNGIFND